MTTPTEALIGQAKHEAIGRYTATPSRAAFIAGAEWAAAQPAPAPDAPHLMWAESPRRTEWGAGMMEALIALGNDHTLSLYAEAEALHLVGPLLAGAAPVAQQAEPPKPDIPPGWESSYAIGDLLLAVTSWKATTPRNARPAFDDLVKACAALVAAAHPQHPAPQPLTEAQIHVMKLAAADQGITGIAPSLHLARAVEAAHGISAAQVAPAADTGGANG